MDRGDQGLEIVTLLMCLAYLEPDRVLIQRGNHEYERVNKDYGFYDEFVKKVGSAHFPAVSNLFDSLPIATIVNNKIFIVHGGIPDAPFVDIISELEKHPIPHHYCTRVTYPFLWADPTDEEFSKPEVWRYHLSPSTFKTFMVQYGFELMIRSHQLAPYGVHVHTGHYTFESLSCYDMRITIISCK